MLGTDKTTTFLDHAADLVQANKCPYHGTPMIIDTQYDRHCPLCGYSDSNNVKLKVNLIFRLAAVSIKEVYVIACQKNGTFAFQRQFQDTMTADTYLKLMNSICL